MGTALVSKPTRGRRTQRTRAGDGAAQQAGPGGKLRLHIEFERLPLGTLRQAHRQDFTHHVGETNGDREAIIVVSGIIIDLGEAHDVVKDCFQRGHGELAAESGDKQGIGSLRPDVCVKLGDIAVGPEVGVLVVQ
jgi:hypothetical protein